MPYWRLYYHIVWATKNREPLIAREVREGLAGYLVGKAVDMTTIVHAIGCAEDHVHITASVPPATSVADFVARLKGSSSHYLNNLLADAFAWQEGYGAFSIGISQIDDTTRYIASQAEHHRTTTFQEEFLAFLTKHNIEYDPRYVWG